MCLVPIENAWTDCLFVSALANYSELVVCVRSYHLYHRFKIGRMTADVRNHENADSV